ncbi:MAG TPA: heparinase II/III family protein, partial [Gemmatimonadaceae bacterium]|nr:heparinase II/III family protein [Gemmatimonadaceae bacterium]
IMSYQLWLAERAVHAAALIAGYDEGMSNRQVWNDAALMAAHLFLGQRDAAAALVCAPTGLAAQLAHGLLHDGSWYEGENYHLFAHRGLWYGVTLAEQAGLGPLPAELRERFAAGFALPFRTALPDLTFPARRDSQYAVSLRQWRFAELAELGLAREPGDPRLRAALARLYAADVPHADTGRARSTAEAERNEPASALTRADLGWRSLLLALPELPELHAATPGTELLDGQGLAVFRRDAGRAYVALDYGHGGGGHGHPDRLNVLFATGHTRWLDDPGTGSYVDPSLFWYRSTLAHHAPLVDGVSQRRVHGELLAFDEQGGAGWVDARASEVAPGVVMRRALVVMGDYWLDELTWTAAHDARIELPFHVAGARLAVGSWQAAAPAGGEDPSDGFPSLRDVERAPAIGAVTRLAADGVQGPAVIAEAQTVDAWVAHGDGASWWRAWAPGPPGSPARPFAWLRVHGTAGRIVTVWSWRRTVQAVTIEGERTVVSLADGTRHRHQRWAHGWQVRVGEPHARTVVRLAGARRGSDVPESSPSPSAAPGDAEPRSLGQGALWRFELGAESYRASEDAWQDVGRPSATVTIGR